MHATPVLLMADSKHLTRLQGQLAAIGIHASRLQAAHIVEALFLIVVAVLFIGWGMRRLGSS